MLDITKYNVTKDGFCASAKDSIPIGNGDSGANVWIDTDGKINLLISKTDAISETTRMIKVGLVKISFEPQIFTENNLPSSTLDLQNGTITVTDKDNTTSVQIAAFRNKSLFGVRVKSEVSVKMKSESVIWRKERRTINPDAEFAVTYSGAPFTVEESADVVVDENTWYHYNEWSYLDYTRKNQHLYDLKDNIRHRIFHTP